MSRQGKQPPSTTEVEAIMRTLSQEEQEMYVSVLYSIAEDAIKAKCKELKVMDLEIKCKLEEKGNANFEEWLHGCIIGRGKQ